MRILHFLILPFFSALVAKNACSQDPSGITDSLFQRKFPELGLHQFKRTCKTGKEEFTVIQVFNSKGQRIEQLSHNASGWTREKQTFDENGNPKMSIYFNEHDTASIATTLVYTYANPLDYKVEIFDKGIALRETFTYQTRETKDTIWVTKTHKTIGNDHIRKTLNRTTQRGDSLTLSEFVKFDERGKIANVEASFETKRKDEKGNTISEYGRCDIRIDESQLIYGDPMRNPEPYFKNQLKGMYPYRNIEDYTPSKTYNPLGQLILVEEMYRKQVFHYNEQAQLIKIESSENPEITGREEKKTVVLFNYDSRGLPTRITNTSHSGMTVEYLFEYK